MMIDPRFSDLDLNEVLNTPMQRNDAGAATIREYLTYLLTEIWNFREEFSGKRPFGNSGWEYELYTALVVNGIISGQFDEYGSAEMVDTDAGDRVIAAAILKMGETCVN